MITFFSYPPDIRKVIYATNAVESLNSVIRKSVKTKKLFPSDDSAIKIIFLVIQATSKKWDMSIQNWKPAINRFMIELKEQLAPYVFVVYRLRRGITSWGYRNYRVATDDINHPEVHQGEIILGKMNYWSIP